jgi:hypothetical protein
MLASPKLFCVWAAGIQRQRSRKINLPSVPPLAWAGGTCLAPYYLHSMSSSFCIDRLDTYLHSPAFTYHQWRRLADTLSICLTTPGCAMVPPEYAVT